MVNRTMELKEISPENWRLSAARFVNALTLLETLEQKHSLLIHIAKLLEVNDFSGFLKLLLLLAECDDEQAKRECAKTIAYSLKSLDLPVGALTAWGNSQFFSHAANALSANRFSFSSSISPARNYAPIEYLTVWFCQKTHRPYLSETMYFNALEKLLALLKYDDEAYRIYPFYIKNELENSSEGAYISLSRRYLLALVEAWSADANPSQIVLKLRQTK